MSRARHEWYAEEVYDPSPSIYEPPEPTSFLQGVNYVGTKKPDAPKVGDLWYDTTTGKLLGFVAGVNGATGQVQIMTQGSASGFVKALQTAVTPIKNVLIQLGKQMGKTKLQSDYVLFPGVDHNVLNIKFDRHVPTRPPHSMAPPPGTRLFDHRGRKRY